MLLKPLLGSRSGQRHLAALKARSYTAARTGILALMALAGCLAVAGTAASALAEGLLDQSPVRGESSCKFHVTCTSFGLCFCYLYQVGDLGDLALCSGIVGLSGLIPDLVKAQGVSGSDLLVVTTVQALYQFDLQ